VEYNWAYPHRKTLAKVETTWETCGPDTIHATFREGGTRTPEDLAALLQEFQLGHDLPTSAVIRDRGVSGFEAAAVDKAAGLRLDWTRPSGEGANKGYFCLQVKGEWFDSADPQTTADFIQLLEAYGIYRITRLDIQQTVETKRYLTPWWVNAFDKGMLRVVGKKYYQPAGLKAGANEYPAGATLYHGSRTSERFARQYDRHKKTGVGPPRRRDEIEIKGDSSRRLWAELIEELAQGEQLERDRAATLHAFSKSAIRAYLPIRDISRWRGRDLPKDWAQYAEEPMNWTELFQEEARGIQPAPQRVTSLLKSYRYATKNFGSAVAAMAASGYVEDRRNGYGSFEAQSRMYSRVMDDFVLAANEDRVHEFFAEYPRGLRDEMEIVWESMKQRCASDAEERRDDDMDIPNPRITRM